MKQPRVLLISTAFFGYEQDIRVALERRGAVVDYFDERPSNHSVIKALLRISRVLIRQKVRSHFEWIYRTVARRTYDLVLVIKGEVVPDWFLARLREDQPRARFVYYTFDAIHRFPNCLDLFPFFDRCYSFDFEDVRKYPQLQLKHLFYSREYTPGPPLQQRDYDISFVGTLHSARYAFVQNVFSHFDKAYRYFYVPAQWLYYLSRIMNLRSRYAPREHVSFQKLSRNEVATIFKECRAVLDMQRAGQSGLTMRTFEALASGATLITSNPYIRETDLFDPARVIVLAPEGPTDVVDLVERVRCMSRDGRPPLGFERYSLDSWVAEFTEEWSAEPLETAHESYR